MMGCGRGDMVGCVGMGKVRGDDIVSWVWVGGGDGCGVWVLGGCSDMLARGYMDGLVGMPRGSGFCGCA